MLGIFSPGGTGFSLWRKVFVLFVGAIAMAALSVSGNSISAVLGSHPLMALVLIAPVIEEIARYMIIDLLDVEKPGGAVFTGGVMGVAESALLLLGFGGCSLSTMVFRLLVSVPFHAFAGGMLFKSPWSLLPAMFLHGLLNFGVYLGGSAGVLISFNAAVVAGFACFLMVFPYGDESEAANPTTGS